MQTAGAEILLAAYTARNNRDLSMFRDRISPVLLLVISAGFNKTFYLCSKDNMAGGNSNLELEIVGSRKAALYTLLDEERI